MINPPILIVLYDPTEAMINRIIELEKKCRLYLFDNSLKATSIDLRFAKYYHSTNNVGISGALKWMLNECHAFDISCFIFFDQDTIFSRKTIDSIADQLQGFSSQTALAHFTSENKTKGLVRFVINSGTLFYIQPLQKIEPILDRYFVDAVDLAICHHVRKYNYIISCNAAPDIDHVAEQGMCTWRFLGFEFTGKIYNESRRRDFYKSHTRLLLDCIGDFYMADCFDLIKYMVSYLMHQLKCDFFKRYGNKA